MRKVYKVYSGSSRKYWNKDYNKKVFEKPDFVFSSFNKNIALKFRDKEKRNGARSFIKTRVA